MIELDEVYRQAVQGRQIGVADAKIIQRNLYVHGAQCSKSLAGALTRQDSVLGAFDVQIPRVDRMRGAGIADHLHETRMLKIACRHVNGDRQLSQQFPLRLIDWMI